MGFPVTAFHSRAAVSPPPVRSRCAIGADGHMHVPALTVHHDRPDDLAGRRVPTLRRAADATDSADDRLAIRAEGRSGAHVLTIENQPEGLAAVGIPEPYCVVATGGEKGLAIGAECHDLDRAVDASGRVRWAGWSPRPRAAPSCPRSRSVRSCHRG